MLTTYIFVNTFLEEAGVGVDSFRGIAMHMPTDTRRSSFLAKFLRMIVLMTTLAAKRAVVVISATRCNMGGLLRTEARVVTPTVPTLTAWLRSSFKVSLWSTPICAIAGSRSL